MKKLKARAKRLASHLKKQGVTLTHSQALQAIAHEEVHESWQALIAVGPKTKTPEKEKPTYYKCGICDHYHPALWDGDCREDKNRFFVDQLNELHGPHGWVEIEMAEIDTWRKNKTRNCPHIVIEVQAGVVDSIHECFSYDEAIEKFQELADAHGTQVTEDDINRGHIEYDDGYDIAIKPLLKIQAACNINPTKGKAARLLVAAKDAFHQFEHNGDESDSDKTVLDELQSAIKSTEDPAYKARKFFETVRDLHTSDTVLEKQKGRWVLQHEFDNEPTYVVQKGNPDDETCVTLGKNIPSRKDLARIITQHLNGEAQYSLIPKVAALQKEDWHGEHEIWDRESWRVQAGMGETQLGYWEWLEHRLEHEDEDDRKTNPAKIDPKELTPKITAETHDDERRFEVKEFDVTEWFAQATDEEIVGLIKIGFGGDLESDAVAEYYDGKNQAVTDMFKYKETGFECNVDPVSAGVWIKIHRPHLAQYLKEE